MRRLARREVHTSARPSLPRGVATRALAGGHTVTLLGTEPEKARALAGELSGDVRAGTVGDPSAATSSCSPSGTRRSTTSFGRYGDQLTGKTVVDITNPVDDLRAAHGRGRLGRGGDRLQGAGRGAVRRLAESAGLRVLDAGPLAHARQLEGAGYLHMAIQPGLGGTYASALKIVS